ncbi:hypothetical protein [Paenibacillus contaminans]|uniref:Uncharacterized protein n=1 Tax=Paenibacillus contaminans TaxID=450362 RepID=A0A329MIC4_9BACL|nr:hypothetical protein [Paenibacillus contaminans]RAV19470.1 hypothetical protein DQG23_20995 [Paenibacillus contaminans]
MKIHKLTIIYMMIVCAAALSLALFLDYKGVNFWSNIAVGILSSGVLALIISVVGYNIERRRTLEEFYTQACKAVRNLGLYEHDENEEQIMRTIIKMADYDYSALNTSYANIDFIWNSKKLRNRIYNNVYLEIVTIKNEIADKVVHFQWYLTGKTTNLPVMQYYIKELDKILVMRNDSEFHNQDGSVTKMSYVCSSTSRIIEEELNTWYFQLMYGKKASTKVPTKE